MAWEITIMDKVFEASLCETYVKTYVFMWNGALREEFNFYFSGVFASIGGGRGRGGGGGLSFSGATEHQPIICEVLKVP